MNKKILKIGDKVIFKVKRYNGIMTVNAKVKDVRSSFGFAEYLLTECKMEEFWARNVEPADGRTRNGS